MRKQHGQQVGRVALALFAIAAASIGAPKTAAAQNYSVASPAYNWSGLYVGANLGYGRARDTGALFRSFTDPGDVNNTDEFFANGGNFLPGAKPDGVIGGAQIGYNWHASQLVVLGIIADLDAANIDDRASRTFMPVLPSGQFFAASTQKNRASIDWLGTVRGKFGFALSDWLIYATGGLAYGRVSTNVVMDCFGCNNSLLNAGSNSATKTGWALGGGVDWALSPRWTLGAEYLRFDLGEITTLLVVQRPPGSLGTFTANSEFVGDLIRFSINYKVGEM